MLFVSQIKLSNTLPEDTFNLIPFMMQMKVYIYFYKAKSVLRFNPYST